LLQVEGGAYSNLALAQYLEGPGAALSRLDKNLLTELVQGVVKWRLMLDWLIDHLANRADSIKPDARNLLRLGLYQLCRMDRIPVRAAVFETVQLAKQQYHSGVAGLVNGVLRSWIREPERVRWPNEKKAPAAFLSARYSHPLWLTERWVERYGPDRAKAFCEYNNNPPPLWLRTNTLRLTPADFALRLMETGCQVKSGRFAPEAVELIDGPPLRGLPGFKEGWFVAQDESAMLPARALAPAPGQNVLDTCAAPGGKTTHLAQLMEGRGSITAWDIHPHRVALIQGNARRLGIGIIQASVYDASAPDGAGPGGMAGAAENGGAAGADPEAAGSGVLYDRILVDAPCSGLGVLRRRADARWRKTPATIREMAGLQKKILRAALGRLAPGGKLVYSTCTTEPEENRLLVESVLEERPDCVRGSLGLSRLGLEDGWDMKCLPFLQGLEGGYMAVIEKRG
jgi:16S rRNA (cytosine967-C5)-methyltransferase